MRRAAWIACGLACVAAAGSCGSSPAPTAPTAILTPAPAPPTYSISGIAKEAWLDIGLAAAIVNTASGPSQASTISDNDGRYTLAGLRAGDYTIAVSKPPLFPVRTYSLTVSGDTAFSPAISARVSFPLTSADVTGYWYGGGPFPNSPFRLVLFQNGDTLTGGYVDRQNATYHVTGTIVRSDITLHIDFGESRLEIDAGVDDERHAHGNMWNSALGNFPFTMTR